MQLVLEKYWSAYLTVSLTCVCICVKGVRACV